MTATTSFGEKLSEKARNTCEIFRHIDDPSGFRVLKKFLARLMRPLSFLTYELIEDYRITLHKLDILSTRLAEHERRCTESHTQSSHQYSVFPQVAEIVSEEQWSRFYHAFENEFRGNYELIRERMANRYFDRLSKLVRSFSPRPVNAVDLGCGRGEFLEICRGAGFNCKGTDLSSAAVAFCANKKLDVSRCDALTFMRQIKENSVHVIGSFHMIEHCDPRYVFKVFQEAFRCLVPSGVFIVETPNGQSLWARTKFNLDPTHLSPIHPEYLEFIGKYFGFEVKIETFDAPRGPMIPQLSKITGGAAGDELAKFESWAYAPMDLTGWNTKPPFK